MLEAKFVLPIATPSGRDLTGLHDALEIELCQVFGGFHAERVRGGWKSPEGNLQIETCFAYTVAMPSTNETGARLRAIAVHYARLAEQQAYYLRFANGEVEIVNIDTKAAS